VPLIRDEAPCAVGQVWMINIAAVEQTDEVFMIRILDPVAVAGAGSDRTVADPDHTWPLSVLASLWRAWAGLTPRRF